MERINFRALCNIIEILTRDNIRAYQEELLGFDVNHAEKDMVLSNFVSSQQSWAFKEPKLTIQAISNADDAPIFELDEAARRLCQQLSGIFSARSSNIRNWRAETMLALVQRSPP